MKDLNLFIGRQPSTSRLLAKKAQRWGLHLLSWLYRGDRFFCGFCRVAFRKMKGARGRASIRGVEVTSFTPNAICPRCHSLIRHRFVLEYMKTRPDWLMKTHRVLHFAPEECFYKLLKAQSKSYEPVDYSPSTLGVKARFADVTSLDFASGSFDRVLAIHVLEHIPDDICAISEIYRVLRPQGQAIIAVPIYGSVTYEKAGLHQRERAAEFGAGDHFRLNGLDFAKKLERAGFAVATVSIDDVPGCYFDRSATSPHIESDKFLFHCLKPH